MSDEAELKRINAAAVQMSNELLKAGHQISLRVQQQRGLSEFETIAAIGNAYLQVMSAAWQSLYDVDVDHFGPALMQFLKDYLRTNPPKEKQ